MDQENGKRKVERMRSEGRWRSAEQSKRDKDTTKRTEVKEGV
jgi:hypothetical protein